MVKFVLMQADRHSTKILHCRKNLRFLDRTDHKTKPLPVILQ